MDVVITGSLSVNGIQIPQAGFSFPTTPGLPGQVIVSNGDGTTSWANPGGSVSTTVVVGTVTLQDSAGSGTWSLSLPTGPGTAGQVLQTDGTGITTWVTPSSGGGPVIASIPFLISNGGSVITAGLQGWMQCEFACTIQSVTLLSDQSGSITVDIEKCSYSQYNPGTHPGVGDSICASDIPAIGSTFKYTDTALTSWTTTINAGDILAYRVTGTVTNITSCSVNLSVLKS